MTDSTSLNTSSTGKTYPASAPTGPLTLEQAEAMAARRGETVVPTWCGMCGPRGNCAVYAFVKDGKFLRVAGMKEAPPTEEVCAARPTPRRSGSIPGTGSPRR